MPRTPRTPKTPAKATTSITNPPRKPRTQRSPAKPRTQSQMCQEWVGGGAPPPGGVSMEFGAKLAQNASAERKVAYFWTFLSWRLYNIAPWRAPASILEAPGLDLGGLRLYFFKIFACFWPCVPRTCRDLAQLVDRNLDARLHWTPHSQPLKVHACIPMDAAVSA